MNYDAWLESPYRKKMDDKDTFVEYFEHNYDDLIRWYQEETDFTRAEVENDNGLFNEFKAWAWDTYESEG